MSVENWGREGNSNSLSYVGKNRNNTSQQLFQLLGKAELVGNLLRIFAESTYFPILNLNKIQLEDEPWTARTQQRNIISIQRVRFLLTSLSGAMPLLEHKSSNGVVRRLRCSRRGSIVSGSPDGNGLWPISEAVLSDRYLISRPSVKPAHSN